MIRGAAILPFTQPAGLDKAGGLHPDEAARAICRRHAASFYFASHFLPRRKRRHAYAVYAFCRLLDDAVDEAPNPVALPTTSLDRLASLEDVLDAAYAGQVPSIDGASEQAALVAFGRTVRECAIPRSYFSDLIQGCRMDLSTDRYATWDQLQGYCFYVAGVVGLIMCRILEVHDPSAQPQAVALGNAMQLTNILRDVREDLARGRIYLPLEDLEHFGVTEADLGAGRCNERFRDLMRFEVARARELYREGCAGLCKLPRDGSRLTAAVMASVYSGILDVIESAGYDVFAARRRLTLGQKLARLPRAMRLNRGRGGEQI